MEELEAREAAEAYWRDQVERIEWLRARTTVVRGQLSAARVGRPYRDRARKQLIRRARTLARRVEANLATAERSARGRESSAADADEADAAARLLRAANGLLNVACSSLHFAGARVPKEGEQRLDYDDVRTSLKRDPGDSARHLQVLQHRLAAVSELIDADSSATGDDRKAAWAEVAGQAITVARRWTDEIGQRIFRHPVPKSPDQDLNAMALAAATAEAEVDYLELATKSTVMFCQSWSSR